MKKVRSVYTKMLKFIRLSAIWVIKILFAPSHFKIPVYRRIYFAIFGGFMPDQIAIYNLNRKNKKEYLSEFDWYKSRYINEPYNFILNNKLVCADLLKQYISVPQTLYIKKKGVVYSCIEEGTDYKNIVQVLKKIKQAYIKPINIGKGIGVNKLSYEEEKIYIDFEQISEKEFIKFLQDRDNWFISECAIQNKTLNNIYDKTSNTIRLITVRNPKNRKCEVLYAVQRIGTKETIPVDNGSRGGLVAKIDIETGVMSSAKSIQKNVNYTHHPDSKKAIEGVKIENWQEIKDTFSNLMEKFPYLYFVAWDVLLTEKGATVIEANASSGVNIIQLWGGQRNKGLGDFYRYHKIIK